MKAAVLSRGERISEGQRVARYWRSLPTVAVGRFPYPGHRTCAE